MESTSLESTLLVPMQLDVMVLNQAATTSTPFLRFKMLYKNLGEFKSAEPAPFAGASTTAPKAGIYLHWTLPKELRHGRHREDGSTEFPLVPNRWLVTRTQAGIPPERAVKAWILESDYISTSNGTSPFVDPDGTGGGNIPKPTKIGRALRLLPSLTSLAVQKTPFLRAVGPGSVYFSVFQAGAENVFSFHDDVTDVDDISGKGTEIAKGTFTYSVVGWYSDPAHDPLADTTWSESNDPEHHGAWRNDRFDWLVYTTASGPPKRMLTHTLVSGAEWNRGGPSRPADNYPTDIQNRVKVAVGNTAVDALSGMVRLFRGSEAEADLLEAFQYGLLEEFNKPGSSEALNMAIRRHWFGASPGGALWEIVPKQRSGDTSLPAPPEPIITGPQGAALAALNGAQEELDRARRMLESMQWNLYALWWKQNWKSAGLNTMPVDEPLYDWLMEQFPLQVGIGSTCAGEANGPTDGAPDNETWYICTVRAQKELVDRLEKRKKDAVDALLPLLDPTQELKESRLPEYHVPNDPVILVTGLGRSTNFDPGANLVCRVLSQAISALTVSGTTYATDPARGTDISARIPRLVDPNRLLPSGALALHVESFFLSPILFAADILDPSKADAVRAGIKALPAPSATGTQFRSPEFARNEWTQPWVPLLLDWDITLLRKPAYGGTKNDPTAMLNRDNWKFDGTDYKWVGPTDPGGGNFSVADAQMQLMGRTFITPQITFTLADQLQEYVKTHKERDPDLQKLLDNLNEYLQAIKGQDILSQRLSGVTSMMLERNPAQSVAPTGAIGELIGNGRHGHPMPSPNPHSSWADAVMNFTPMRGTFYVINRLSVIDMFGRTIDLMLANFSDSPQEQGTPQGPYFFPITGRDVKSPTAKDPRPGRGKAVYATERMVQLTPRMAQDSQLRLRLLSSDGRDTDITTTAGANPVCGWVVPNHLDRSLAFYAPDGSAWGELFLSRRFEGKYVPVWEADPANPAAPKSIREIPNAYVRGMLEALTARTDNGQGFNDFITTIDETLWTINPLGQRDDEHLSVLIGRPLAIVRADMALRIRGLRPYNQDWWNTFAVDPEKPGDPSRPAPIGTVDGRVGEYLWPVRLGSAVLRDDGLIGYFLDDPESRGETFKTFNTLRLPAGQRSDYLKPIGDGNYPQLRFIDDATTPEAARRQICRMTMLLDPRGSIHAFTGLLPVASLALPSRFVKPAFQKMFYTFRAGPVLTSPEEIRLPHPAERKGNWSWFDHILQTSIPIAEADGDVRFPTTPSIIREGWLQFTPNPPNDHE